jgi:hypothetical protein
METCIKEGCRFKKGELNAYCGKHQATHFLEVTKEAGKKVCSNYIRGCREQLALTSRSSCEPCLKKCREKDNAARAKKVAQVTQVEGNKACNTCLQAFPLDYFQGIHGETLTCNVCRDTNKRADANRDKKHVQVLARKNAAKPERKEVKQAWKDENYDKVATYWVDARKRAIETDLEGYLKKNAEQAKKWRDANPEKVKELKQQRVNCIESQYGVYQSSAKMKNLEFTIPLETFIEYVQLPCYYCGIIQEKGFNGLDRLDSSAHYTVENCVSCCEMCNWMKGSLSPSVFVHRVEHMLTYLHLVEGNLYASEFENSTNASYHEYKKRATQKSLAFELSEEQFSSIVNQPCYLCGKETINIHKNGIDRFDNTKGYIEENVRSCCWNCNYMKRDYTYDNLMTKCHLIYEYQRAHPMVEHHLKNTKNILTRNKLTKDEKVEKSIERKKVKQEALVEKYTNETTRKEWIDTIVKHRKERSKS